MQAMVDGIAWSDCDMTMTPAVFNLNSADLPRALAPGGVVQPNET